jgi:outer membrane protein assembly factor BamB
VIVDRGSVFFGSADGHAYAIREDTGRLRWLARTGGAIQAVGRADDYLLVPSFDNFVYAFSLSSGRRRWKRQLAGRVIAEPLTGKDGVLFAPLSGDSAIVLSKKTGKVLNSVAVGDDNNSGAGPIVVKNTIVLSTRRGVLAFARR